MSVSNFGISKDEFDGIMRRNAAQDEGIGGGENGRPDDDTSHGGMIIHSRYNDARRGHLDQSQRIKIAELLGAWYVA